MTEWDAAEYAKMSGLQKAMATQVLSLLELAGDERVLDVGCGEGKITALMASRVPRGMVTGVDPSREMIAFASSHFPTDECPNLLFEVADARSLPFRDAFDLVTSFNALHWVPDQAIALRSIRVAMRPTGRAQLRLVTAGERESLESVVERARKSPQWRGYFQDFHDPYLRLTPAQYAATAERNGLHVLAAHTRDETWHFKTRVAFFTFAAVGLVAWTQYLPETERAAFVDDVLDRYRAITGDPPSAETTFKFYQTDFTLARSSP